MLIRIFLVMFFLILTLRINAQVNDAQNLTRDIEDLMYSDPQKAIKAARYIAANHDFDNLDEVYNSFLLQAEICINLKQYNKAVKNLISADRLYYNVSNKFFKAKNEYLTGQIFLLTGFYKLVPNSIQEIDKLAKSLDAEEKNTTVLWKIDLETEKLFYEKKYQDCLVLINKNRNKRSKLYPVFGFQMQHIQSKLGINVKEITYRENPYFGFLSDLAVLEKNVIKPEFKNLDVWSLKKKNPQYSDVFYRNIYKKWSEVVCRSNDFKACFSIRKEYINLLKLEVSDLQNARVSVINLIDQKQRQRNKHEKDFQNKVLSIISIISFLLVISFMFYFLIIRNRIKIVKAELEKRIISDAYEQKLSNQIKNLQASNNFVIPEKTENLILSKLEIFEKSKDVTNPNLSLAVLAKRLDTNSKYLSEIINKNKQKNFSNYLNELRIDYIVEKLENNPEYLQYKTSYLAEEAGFVSRTTFTTIFKTVKGISPSQFIDQLKNKGL